MKSSYLSRINQPADLRTLSSRELQAVVDELRAEIIQVVSQREGHLGASLGAVELTVALHRVFNTPEDQLVWDVGHQAYGHKMLTGRRQAFDRLRQWGGISGFPKREESMYDTFGTGHSSTSISAVLGMALAAQQQGIDRHHIAVIGDASIASGMAFEALNHLGTTDANVLVVLNDNAMGIDPSVGALKHFFETTEATPPKLNLFDTLNIAYSGPIDGHDLSAVLDAMSEQKQQKGPRLLHLRTLKGKGLASAEANQITYHAPGKFDPLTGKLNKATQSGKTKYQAVVGTTLHQLFDQFDHLMAITPAMPTGSGLVSLMEAYPNRCVDVGIAEQHAVTLAAGMASQGLLPFCVIYSTFLQRAYDQLMHDVALQRLAVIFCIDRAGLVGHDGPTHHGIYDLSFLQSLPNLCILAPRDAKTLRLQLYQLAANPPQGPVAIRYPRGYGEQIDWELPFQAVDYTRGSCLKQGSEMAIISIGTLVEEVAEAIARMPNPSKIAHYDLGCIKPLDEALLTDIFDRFPKVISVEESARIGGAGSAIQAWASDRQYSTAILRLGIPDTFVSHGSTEVLREALGLDAKQLQKTFSQFLVS